MTPQLSERFRQMLERYVHRLTIRGQRAMGLCPFYQERSPSFSAHLEKCIFHCFGCGASGGVKRFAKLVGEPWESSRRESRAAKARRARFQAERQARVILEQRVESRDRALCAQHRELYGETLALADLLAFFHRRPDLAQEFNDVLQQTEKEYGPVLFQLSVLEARLDGEVE